MWQPEAAEGLCDRKDGAMGPRHSRRGHLQCFTESAEGDFFREESGDKEPADLEVAEAESRARD